MRTKVLQKFPHSFTHVPLFLDVLTERTLRHRGNRTCVRPGCRETQGEALEENVWGQRDVQALDVKPGDLNLRTHMVLRRNPLQQVL